MSNDWVTGIRLRLTAVLNSRPEAIVPLVRARMLEARDAVVPGMPIKLIRVVATCLEGISGKAGQYGRTDIACELCRIADALDAVAASIRENNDNAE